MQERPYDLFTETTMIELTEQQVLELSKPHSSPPQLLNPRTNEAFVLLRIDEYKQLTEYDDSPWTREELQSVAAATADRACWDAEADDDDAVEIQGSR